MKRFLEIGGVAAGVVLIAFGAAAIVLQQQGRNTIANELGQQKIVGTPDMTPAAITAEAKSAGLNIANTPIPSCSLVDSKGNGLPINTGDRARCFAQYMQVHTLEATHGVPYALMPRYATADGKGTNDATQALVQNGQPVDNAARNIWVTETALTGALNSSYMAEQMANFGLVVGIALLLSGIGFTILALSGALETEFWFAKRRAAKEASSAKATPLSV